MFIEVGLKLLFSGHFLDAIIDMLRNVTMAEWSLGVGMSIALENLGKCQ